MPALLSPVVVPVAVLGTALGGWVPAGATTALLVLRWADRRRSDGRVPGDARDAGEVAA